MQLYGEKNYHLAEPLLLDSVANPSISDDQRIYSAIALADIYQIQNKLTGAVSILEVAWKNAKAASEGERDLGLALSKTYRLRNVSKLVDSFSVAFVLLKQHPNDESVIFNYSVASLFMAGHSVEKGESPKMYYDITFKYANYLITVGKDSEIKAAAYNLIGLTQDRQGNYIEAVNSFKNALKFKDKAIYHRNLGWALYGGVSKKVKGKEKLAAIRNAYTEFGIAIKDGDDDPTTKKQIPNIEKLLQITPKPNEPLQKN